MNDISRFDQLSSGEADTDHEESTTAEAAAETNVEKIRDILFGGQMREYDQRFALLEEKLALQVQGLRQDLTRDLGALKDYARSEFEKVIENQHAERQERAEAVRAVAQSVEQLDTAMESRFADVQRSMDGDGAELRNALHEARSALSTELASVRSELLDLLQRENNALQSSKVSRAEMSGLLNDLAMRLSEEGTGSD